MKRSPTGTVLLAMFCMNAAAAEAAEHEHPAHHHPEQQPSVDPHAHHREHGAPSTTTAAQDPHAHHREHGAPSTTTAAQDPHAHHNATGTQHDAHAQHSAERDQPTESEAAHVPPDPPRHAMWAMSEQEMIELMQMEDNAAFGMVLADHFEWRDTDGGDALVLDGHAWYGTDYNKAWFKAEGEWVEDDEHVRTELLWDRIFSRWWSVQVGARHDFSEGPSRTWAAVGVQGLAPYWFEVEATLYVGDEGRTAARFSGEYDLLLTQRLVLQPQVEVEFFGKDDAANGIGSGLSTAEFGLRLRYEVRREFAPYVGVVWSRQFGGTADLARAANEDVSDVQFVAGVRAWF